MSFNPDEMYYGDDDDTKKAWSETNDKQAAFLRREATQEQHTSTTVTAKNYNHGEFLEAATYYINDNLVQEDRKEFETFLQSNPNARIELQNLELIREAMIRKSQLESEAAWKKMEIRINQVAIASVLPNGELTRGEFCFDPSSEGGHLTVVNANKKYGENSHILVSEKEYLEMQENTRQRPNPMIIPSFTPKKPDIKSFREDCTQNSNSPKPK
jgi:hypothetical protein